MNFWKTRRRPSGSSQLVICSHWRRAESRRNTAKSMLLILTLSSSHKALQDGRPCSNYSSAYSLCTLSLPRPSPPPQPQTCLTPPPQSHPILHVYNPTLAGMSRHCVFHFETNFVEFLHQETNQPILKDLISVTPGVGSPELCQKICQVCQLSHLLKNNH